MVETVMEQVDQGETGDAQEPTVAPESPQEPGEDEEPNGDLPGPQEPSGEPSAPLAQKDMEQAMRKLDSEAVRHRNRVSEILGEDALLLNPCPLCPDNLAGFVWPVEPPDEVKAAVKAMLGEPLEPDYKKAGDARVCDTCEGLGKVLTGSFVPEHRTKLCTRCGGAGWINLGGASPGAASATEALPVVTPPQPPPEELPDIDPWGRPRGSADYGRLPNYMGS